MECLKQGAVDYLLKDRLARLASAVLWAVHEHRLREERLHMEQCLRTSEERWHLAIEGNTDAIWDWNILTAEIFFAPRWKEMLGYTDNEVGNRFNEWSERVHPDDLEQAKRAIDDHFGHKTAFYSREFRMRCKDGTYKWILARGKALWDERGNAVRMVGSNTDITEWKRSKEKFRRLLEYIPDALVIINGEGQITLVNSQTERLFGYARTILLGQPIEMLVPQRFRVRHAELRAGYMKNPHTALRPVQRGRQLRSGHISYKAASRLSFV